MIKHVSLFFLTILSGVAIAAPDGQSLFQQHCSACHGDKGEGGVGVPLSLPSFIDSVADNYLRLTIRLGRPGRIMPAFSSLSDAQVDAIVTFMQSWSTKPTISYNSNTVKGDSKKGATLFAKHCRQCHGENGQGGHGTGVTFSRKREIPILAPALNNTGFLASASDEMIRDTIIYGREGTPMTSMLVAGLSEDDVDDIVSFVRSFEAQHRDTQVDSDIAAVIIEESPYSLNETIDNLKQAITDQNFTLIRTDHVDHGLVAEDKENIKQVVLHFCNFGFLFKALALDPRIGMFLPCRVTVVEKDGKVMVMSINPLYLSKLFNNDELKAACKEMKDIYSSIIGDAVL